MIVSIETPVFKGKWLTRCIDSVLTQSSNNWVFSLVWDGGDEQSREILEELAAREHPNIRVYFEENRGIANARHFLSARCEGDYILPLDDDDVLAADAVEKLQAFAEARPWCSMVRGRRKFIDEEGRVVDEEPWFPFEPRHYQHGMVTDVFNHSQPYLMNRAMYDKTAGWAGFEDFMFAGEDCDIILKLEELGPIELIDEVLYYYRLNPNRASDTLEVQGAHEMWRRLADLSIARIGLPLKRTNEVPPYTYERLPQPRPDIAMIDFVIPVAGELASSEHRIRHQAVLQGYGIADDAMHFIAVQEGGLAASFNACCRQTSRPLICLLDERTRIEEQDFFDTMLDTLHEQTADILGPKILDVNGSIIAAAPSFDADQLPVPGGPVEADGEPFNDTADALWLPAHLMLLRREVVNAVGGFDEAYACSEIASADFCLKARLRDFRCLYTGATLAIGEHHRPSGERGKSIDRYNQKWIDYAHLFWDNKPAG